MILTRPCFNTCHESDYSFSHIGRCQLVVIFSQSQPITGDKNLLTQNAKMCRIFCFPRFMLSGDCLVCSPNVSFVKSTSDSGPNYSFWTLLRK